MATCRSMFWAALVPIFAIAPVSGLHYPAATREKRGKGLASAHVYVINLDNRTDKCACMSSQLASAPYMTTRFSAVSGDKLFDYCPNFHNPRLGGHSQNNTMALTCGNLLIWEQAVKEDFEFAIIMEDDTILSEDAWSKIDKVLQGGCADWDYIMVDAWHGGRHSMKNFSCSPSTDMPMYRLDYGYGGSHIQIWRRDALPCAINWLRAWGYANPMDKVVTGISSPSCPIRAAAGFFGVGFQASKRKVDPQSLPSRCAADSIDVGDRTVPREFSTEPWAFECNQ